MCKYNLVLESELMDLDRNLRSKHNMKLIYLKAILLQMEAPVLQALVLKSTLRICGPQRSKPNLKHDK